MMPMSTWLHIPASVRAMKFSAMEFLTKPLREQELWMRSRRGLNAIAFGDTLPALPLVNPHALQARFAGPQSCRQCNVPEPTCRSLFTLRRDGAVRMCADER
jgi:hypothetical protein